MKRHSGVRQGSPTKPRQEERIWHRQHDRIAGAILFPIHPRVLTGSPGRQNARGDHESNAREPADRAQAC